MPQERNFYRVYFYDHLYVQGLKDEIGAGEHHRQVCPVIVKINSVM